MAEWTDHKEEVQVMCYGKTKIQAKRLEGSFMEKLCLKLNFEEQAGFIIII